MFLLKKVDNGRINVGEPEFYPVASTALVQGEGVKLVSGKLQACGTTTKPTFITIAAASASAAKCPVLKVYPDQLYEADASVSVSAAVVGTKVTLASGCDQITATTSDGVATIVAVLADKKALVRFE